MRRMNRLLNLLFILGLNGLASSQWTTDSKGKSEVQRCFADIEKGSDITHLLLDVTSLEKIDAFCGRFSQLKKCVADKEHHLTTAENTAYLQKTRGINSFYINVCPPGTDITQKYKDNAPCFELIKHQILICGSDLPEMSSFKMQSDVKSRCCALKSHKECVTKAATAHCDREAGQVVEKILLSYFHSQWKGCEYVSLNDCRNYRSTTEADDFADSRYNKDRRGSDRKFWNGGGHSTVQYPDKRYGSNDHDRKSTDFEDWRHPTPSDHWGKHKPKSSSDATSSITISGVISGLGFVLLEYFYSKYC